jgi:hypothetical protein
MSWYGVFRVAHREQARRLRAEGVRLNGARVNAGYLADLPG